MVNPFRRLLVVAQSSGSESELDEGKELVAAGGALLANVGSMNKGVGTAGTL
jgi:hypothetical protein